MKRNNASLDCVAAENAEKHPQRNKKLLETAAKTRKQAISWLYVRELIGRFAETSLHGWHVTVARVHEKQTRLFFKIKV